MNKRTSEFFLSQSPWLVSCSPRMSIAGRTMVTFWASKK